MAPEYQPPASREADLHQVILKYYRAALPPVLPNLCGTNHIVGPRLKMSMSTGAKPSDNGGAEHLPPWAECDLFCIRNYAGTVNSACGWRGRIQDARHDAAGTSILCPRCGCATLFRIPLDPTDPR